MEPLMRCRACSWGGFAPSSDRWVQDEPWEGSCHPPTAKARAELPQPQGSLAGGAEQERIQVAFCKMAAPPNPPALRTTLF